EHPDREAGVAREPRERASDVAGADDDELRRRAERLREEARFARVVAHEVDRTARLERFERRRDRELVGALVAEREVQLSALVDDAFPADPARERTRSPRGRQSDDRRTTRFALRLLERGEELVPRNAADLGACALDEDLEHAPADRRALPPVLFEEAHFEE